jgi:uncharacterized protein YndB with AHSA1/START domain
MRMGKLKVLPGAPNEIVWEREFDAPRRLVLKAMMTPELITQWLGGVRATVISAEVDARVGGSYRYVLRANNGHQFAFGGTYRELSDDRVVHTEKFDDYPNESVVTVDITESGGKTKLHMVIAFESAEIRELVAKTGMAEGAGESYDKLEELIARL